MKSHLRSLLTHQFYLGFVNFLSYIFVLIDSTVLMIKFFIE